MLVNVDNNRGERELCRMSKINLRNGVSENSRVSEHKQSVALDESRFTSWHQTSTKSADLVSERMQFSSNGFYF